MSMNGLLTEGLGDSSTPETGCCRFLATVPKHKTREAHSMSSDLIPVEVTTGIGPEIALEDLTDNQAYRQLYV